MDLKQAILVRNDLKLPKGKMTAQGAHASVEAVLRSEKDMVKAWRNQGMGKIVLKVENQKELYTIIDRAKQAGLATSIITDAGKTVVEPGTVTCGAIGPDASGKLDEIIGKLKLM